MGRPTFDEGTAKTYRITFYDESGQPAAPVSIAYRIDCLNDGSEIRADTAVTPAATVDITVDGNDNRLVTTRARETHRLTIKIVDAEGPDSEFKDFDVRRT